MSELNVKINGKKTICADKGVNLRELLSGNGIELGVCQGRGVCGRCKIKTNAKTALTEREEKKLDKSQIDEGYRLACQITLESDIKMELDESLMPLQEFTATCSAIVPLTEDIKLYRLNMPKGEELGYEPGQYILLSVPEYEHSECSVTRTFSIASDPADKTKFELIIRRTPNGICTRYLFENLKVGEVLEFQGPGGDFALTKSTCPAVMIAGGSGMSSIRNILFQIKNQQNRRKILYFFGVETEKQLYLLDEMKEFEDSIPNFKFIPVVNKPTDNWTGETGLVTDAVHRHFESLAEAEAFLCGSPGMINASIEVMKKIGLTKEHIYFDAFG